MLATAELPGAGFGNLGAFCNFGAIGFLAVAAPDTAVFVVPALAPSLAPIPAAVVLDSRTAPVAEVPAELPEAAAAAAAAEAKAEEELAFFFFFKVDPAEAAVFFVAAFFFVIFFAAGLAVVAAAAGAVVVAAAAVEEEGAVDGASTEMALAIAAAALAETLTDAAPVAGVVEAATGAFALLWFADDEAAALAPLEEGVGLGGMFSGFLIREKK
mmetsp:Transcript_19668/g.41414  ORF Transcript_19668/g.41414 Transcript_19668/m.41414 type:complete len:214 (+) Transcript_19668:2027-2668(+)